ncbi:ATP-binding protein [Streptomyces sp. c-19]|uniref:ATP-binding protein n=1 Tax=Streptomyces sp. c-19 TaxID=2789275 RepID=UPI00397FEDE5
MTGVRHSALEGLVPTLASEAADTVVLVVPELVTNAPRHGGGTCTLDLTAHLDSIEVAVHDHSPRAPRTRSPPADAGQEYERHDVAAAVGGPAWALCRPAAAAEARSR